MTVVESFGVNARGGTQMRRRWETPNAKGAVLIVHGIGEHSGRYVHVGDHLASKGFDVMAYDNVGFGQSEGEKAFVKHFDDYIEDVEALLAERRELGVPVILLGHSLGGLICATYLIGERPQPDLAILSSPALGAVVPTWQRILAPIIGRFFPKYFIPSKIDGVVLSRDVAVQEGYTNDPLVIAGSTAGLGRAIFSTMPATAANIGKITVPTYVLHGADDALVPAKFSEPLAALPNVTRRVWEGLRHECFNEPEQVEVMTEMTDWLDKQLSH